MADKQDFQMNGVSQIKIRKKWVLLFVLVLTIFFMIVGSMLVVTAMSRPATVNSGGYTHGKEW